MRVYYSPTKVGVHQQMLKIYYSQVDDASTNDRYRFFIAENWRSSSLQLTVHCQAVAVHRTLAFSQHNLVLPNTVVNIPSRVQFWIYNVGYKNTSSLRIFFPPELSKCVLLVEYPWGNKINHMIKMLPVIITFVSDVQMSFLAQLAVLDEDNIPYYIQLSGNSYAQTYSEVEFLRYNIDKLDFKSQLSELKYRPLYPPLKNNSDEQEMDMSIATMQQ